MNTIKIDIETGWLKVIIGWVVIFAFRLIPFRPPNVEPMLATIMPFAKRFGALTSFLFGFFSIVLFDAVTSGLGVWTLVTALAYGALGPAAHYYFKTRDASVGNFLTFGIAGTLAYDALTGVLMGPLMFNVPFMVALVGQIPFTLMHLAGTIVFATLLSPALYRWVVQSDAFEIALFKTRAQA